MSNKVANWSKLLMLSKMRWKNTIWVKVEKWLESSTYRCIPFYHKLKRIKFYITLILAINIRLCLIIRPNIFYRHESIRTYELTGQVSAKLERNSFTHRNFPISGILLFVLHLWIEAKWKDEKTYVDRSSEWPGLRSGFKVQPICIHCGGPRWMWWAGNEVKTVLRSKGAQYGRELH